MVKRLLSTALSLLLVAQGAADTYAAGAAALSASIGKGSVVPWAPIQFSPASLGGAGIAGTEAQAFALQGILQGIGSPNAASAAPRSGPGSAAVPDGLQVRRAVSAVSNPVVVGLPDASLKAALRPADPGPAPKQVSTRLQSMGRAAAPIFESLRGGSASASSHYSAGQRLADILSGQRTHAAADEIRVPQAQAPAIASSLSQGRQAAEKTAAASGTPAPKPQITPEQSRRFGAYAASVAGIKVAIEALNLAVPILLLSQIGGAVAVSALYLAAEVAALVAGLAGGPLVDRIGPVRTMILTAVVQGASIAALPILLATGGAMAMPAVFALFMLNGAAGELFDVGRRAALPQIVGRDEGALKVFNGKLYVWREVAATAGVFGAGWFVHAVGATSTIYLHPAFAVVAAFALWRIFRTARPDPRDRYAEAVSRAQAAQEKRGAKTGLKEWLREFLSGARHVIGNRDLRLMVGINIPLNVVHKIFHTLIAVVYATQILHNPAMAAVMLGAWNLGEFAGAGYLQWKGRESRISNWLIVAAFAALAHWAFFLAPTAWVAVPVSFLIAAAMIGNELGSASFMQSHVPEKELGAVTGFVYGFARAIGMAVLMAAGWGFHTLGALNGFFWLAVAFSAITPAYLWAARYFRSEKIEAPAPPADDL